jgi:hypothetical protein
VNSKKCPQCKAMLKKRIFDVGYGIEVKSLHCSKCGLNITDERELTNAMNSLHNKVSLKGLKILCHNRQRIRSKNPK